ncbi:MAG: diguanylate cyclase [Desulfobacteraceae bacterium]|nr:MAG: diguanylate cyclase [Desulfobacteraceae bacterium]
MDIETIFKNNGREILDHLSLGIYMTDCNRNIIFWNKGAEALTGYLASEVIGSFCFENILMHIDEMGNKLCKGFCPLSQTMIDSLSPQQEVFLHHKDGHRVSVTVQAFPLKDEEGKISGAAEIFSYTNPSTNMQSRIRELEKIAMFDQLSNLPNRQHIESELTLRFNEFHRYGRTFGVLFLDIDHFKKFNDTWGHDAGDKVIQTVAATLRAASRPFDIFGRWGGEEFVGIILNVDSQNLAMIANRYRKLIEQSSIPLDQMKIGITMSIGATIVKPDDTPESIIKRSDMLMYDCKKSGRNCVASD